MRKLGLHNEGFIYNQEIKDEALISESNCSFNFMDSLRASMLHGACLYFLS